MSYYKYRLKKMNTHQLLAQLRMTYISEGRGDDFDDDYVDYDINCHPSGDHLYSSKDIKDELATRPHVSRKKDRRKPTIK